MMPMPLTKAIYAIMNLTLLINGVPISIKVDDSFLVASRKPELYTNSNVYVAHETVRKGVIVDMARISPAKKGKLLAVAVRKYKINMMNERIIAENIQEFTRTNCVDLCLSA